MKKRLMLLAVMLLVGVLGLSGCSSKKAYTKYTDAQMAAINAYFKAAKEPMVHFKGNCTGPIEMVVHQPVQPIQVQQIKDSEWVPVVTAGVTAVGSLVNTWLTYDLWGAGGTKNSSGDSANGNTVYGDLIFKSANAKTNYNLTGGEGGINNIDFTNKGTESTSNETKQTTTTTTF